MKKAICAILSLCIAVLLAGCGASPTETNVFAAENAKKGQVGIMAFTVPSNAVISDTSDNTWASYTVPIENSDMEYTLSFNFGSTSELTDMYGSLDDYIAFLQTPWTEEVQETAAEHGIELKSRETLSEAFGMPVLYGEFSVMEQNGTAMYSYSFVLETGSYSIGYNAPSSFIDEQLWDNLLAQIKLV